MKKESSDFFQNGRINNSVTQLFGWFDKLFVAWTDWRVKLNLKGVNLRSNMQFYLELSPILQLYLKSYFVTSFIIFFGIRNVIVRARKC